MHAPPASISEESAKLLERAGELEALGCAFDAVRERRRGRLVLVEGEAGVGKTALARRFCDERGGTARILWGACDGLFTPRPLGPLVDVAEITGGDLEEVVGRGALPHEVAAALMRELSLLTSVVVLEDLHWADEATLDVFRLLARRVDSIRALVIASYREDELAGEHPLRVVLGELATARGIQRMTAGRTRGRGASRPRGPWCRRREPVTTAGPRRARRTLPRPTSLRSAARASAPIRQRSTNEHEVHLRRGGARVRRAVRDGHRRGAPWSLVDLGKVRKATAPYRQLDAAKADGYGLLEDAQGIACIDNPASAGWASIT